MSRRCLGGLVALALVGGCARPDTVVHVSAAPDARWEVRDADGERVCELPCQLELDEHEVVSVVRPGSRSRFVLRQEDLGEGEFTAHVRVKKKRTPGASIAGAFGIALSGAAEVLLDSDDDREIAAGVFFAGMGAVARAASHHAKKKRREELWVQRTDTR